MSRPYDERERAAEVTVSEERLRVDSEREQVGSARAVKHVDVEHATTRVERGTSTPTSSGRSSTTSTPTAARSRRSRTAACPSRCSRSSSSSPSGSSSRSG
jgi:hypothetical protein